MISLHLVRAAEKWSKGAIQVRRDLAAVDVLSMLMAGLPESSWPVTGNDGCSHFHF